MHSPYRPLPETARNVCRSICRRAAALLTISLLLSLIPLAHAAPSAASASAPNTAFCSRLVTQRGGTIPANAIAASAAATMYCSGPQSNHTAKPASPAPQLTRLNAFQRTNVDAGNPQEDVAPSGAQAYGQSETSVAATGPYVVEAWNDSTAFFAPCPSPQYKEELTGFGFSTNGGASFTDEGGLPNDCTTGFRYYGDPAVEAWQAGGSAYFYIASLYLGPTSDIALSACQATGTSIACSTPTIVATGNNATPDFLDKEFLAIDPVHGRLYVTYTRFGNAPALYNGQIELAVCDIGTPSGGIGTAGGTAAVPVCFAGASTTPYLVLAPGDPNCENEGAYPAVDLSSGDVYAAWEFNWATAIFNSNCAAVPIQQRLARTQVSCLTLTPISPCATPSNSTSVNIVSMQAAFVPGYNHFPNNDFPRIAVSEPKGTVSIVWNDARFHVLGDILLQSFTLTSLSAVQATPVRLNTLSNGGLHLLPALRNADPDGELSVSFYQRKNANTTLTEVAAAIEVNPRMTSVPASNKVITNVATDWNAVSSDISPNFGDYTDNYLTATTSGATYTNKQLHIAWSDGRLGDPQPFHAHGTD